MARSSSQGEGSPRAATYISPTQLTAQILASDIAAAGAAHVDVSNTAPCGGLSNEESFTIYAPRAANHSRSLGFVAFRISFVVEW